jgi:hypothetical protein
VLQLRGMSLECEERETETETETERAIVKGSCNVVMSSSSSSLVQQLAFAARTANCFLDHESRSSSSSISSSTITWKSGRSTRRRSLPLLRVCVHPQLQFAHQQLLQYTAPLLPRSHRIETEAALRGRGNCKLCCVLPLSLCVCLLPSSHSSCILFAEKC